MKLISCNNCGVVLDQDKINWPRILDDGENVIANNAFWDGDHFVRQANCPVCQEFVLEDE